MTNRFVVVTGIDGSGKDYVVEQLTIEDPSAVVIRTPTEPFMPARLHIDEFALEVPAAHYFFYLASVIHASSLVERALQHSHVYCVRYLLDTVAYHRAMGLPVDLEYETAFYRIRRPDLTFFLTVDDEQVRQSRLAARGRMSVGDRIINDSQLRRAILQEYMRHSSEFIQIDNSGRDIADVIANIRKWM